MRLEFQRFEFFFPMATDVRRSEARFEIWIVSNTRLSSMSGMPSIININLYIIYLFIFYFGITSQKGIELYRVFTEGYWIIIPLESGVLTIKMNPRRAFRLFSALKRNGSRFTWLPCDFFNGFGLLCPWLQRIQFRT